MHAAVISDNTVSWREYPDPEPLGSELLVRVRAAGLNGADIHQLAGNYPAPPGVPVDVPGLELAGTVEATGPLASRFAAGDRVLALVAGGAQAELCRLDERLAAPIPTGLGWAEAGGLPETYCTAWDAVFDQCQLRAGERLLVTGAAGGVGLAATQLALAAGAEVVASVRNDSLRGAVGELGALAVAPDEVPARGPFDVVLELVGAPNLPEDVANLAVGGRIVVIGHSAGHRAELDLRQLARRRGRISASTLRARAIEERALVMRRLEHHVLPLVAAGRCRVLVAATFPFSDVEGAYERFSAGAKLGKVVLVS